MRQRKTIKSTTRQPVTGPPVLVVDGTRMFYRGHWTAAQRRRVGAHVLSLGLDAPFRIDLGNGWLTAEMAYVEPGLMHSMEGGGGSIGEVSLEAETLDRSDLPKPLGGTSGPIRAADEVERWRRACAAYRPPNPGAGTIGASIDEYFFGRPLRRRTLDTRIAAVVARITREPHQFHSALASARHCGLSTSRFQHLFTAQTGVPLRRFCGWKRARSLLEFVSNPASLT
jgi:AraC-like DNA-binding protein